MTRKWWGEMQLEVSGEPTLARATIATYLRRKYRGATVSVRDAQGDLPARGVRIQLGGTDRWLFVGLDWELGEQIAEAIMLGAAAAVTFDGQEEEFERALNALMTMNSVYLSEPSARWLAASVMRAQSVPDQATSGVQVTPRERELLGLLAQGLTNDQIARTLTISTNTVRSHLHSLSMKLDTSSRSALVSRARSLGLLQEETRSAPIPIGHRTA